MSIRRELVKLTAIWIIFLALLLSTQPSDLAFYLLFIPFILLGVAVYSTWRFAAVFALNRGRAALSKRQKAAGITISVAAVVLLGMQSLGELTPRDFVTVILFTLIFYFYSVRNLIQG